MIFKKKKCDHEYELVGDYYKELLTEYKNCFDKVITCSKLRCKKCGEITNVLLTTEEFNPQLHNGREKRRDDYITKLKNMGFVQEVELMK